MVFVKIFPIALMVVLGLLMKKYQIISNEGINGLKTLATSFMLPVLLFHTLATTTFTKNTVITVGVLFLHACLAISLGMLLKKIFPSLGNFLPFIVSSFEGGMLGYPLYMVLCGEENLSHIATLDVANTIFTFTIFIGLLMSTVSGNFQMKTMVNNVAHSPVFWGVAFGILFGVLGFFPGFLETTLGQVYLAGETMLTSAISAIILIVVGYGLSFRKEMLTQCGKAVLARAGISLVLIFLTMFLLRSILVLPEQKLALILYVFLPPTFVVPVYAKTEEESEYLSTTLSLYSVLTILVFVGLSFFA